MYKRLPGNKYDKGTIYSVFQIARYVLWIFAITLILESIGLSINFLIASSAALLVGVGLGLQNIFKDIISGVMLLFDRAVEVGNVIELDGVVGRVLQIGLRTSKIQTREHIVLIIPNSKFIEEYVINWSAMDEHTRFSVQVGVAYGSDVKLVRKVLLDVANKEERIVQEPKPFVRFTNFGESSLDFEVFFWTSHNFIVENIKSDLRFVIDAAFRQNNITIPFPQRDVHHYNTGNIK